MGYSCFLNYNSTKEIEVSEGKDGLKSMKMTKCGKLYFTHTDSAL
jgi:hypothetical protein